MFRRTICFLTQKRPVSRLMVSLQWRSFSAGKDGSSDGDAVADNAPDLDQPPVPPYTPRTGESLDVQKARIVYQSRKRGMLENDLLLSTFCSKFLDKLTPQQVKTFDELINKPDNDWDIYYWIIGKKDPPAEFNTDVMKMLKEFAQNKEMENRTRMPNL